MNICTDQLLLALVPPARIASLSYLSANPDYSPVAAQAARLPLNRGQAEEILGFEPDLILTSQFSAAYTANLLQRLGYMVHRFGFASDVDGIVEQIDTLGALTGTENAASQLASHIRTEAAASSARLQPLLAGERAVFLSNNGFVQGAGTLQDAFLASLGMVNVASEGGLHGPAPLALETLLALAPSVIFVPRASSLDTQFAHPLLAHPLWQRLAPQVRRVALDERWFDCAGPSLLQAYTALERQLLP
ncbi:MAG TPA: ABC transporter substrate-binding protein [Hyphomicrobiales bacterium]|nr:ABC transporter substrate-binding protein [Hyphomicrobiales bacterium]